MSEMFPELWSSWYQPVCQWDARLRLHCSLTNDHASVFWLYPILNRISHTLHFPHEKERWPGLALASVPLWGIPCQQIRLPALSPDEASPSWKCRRGNLYTCSPPVSARSPRAPGPTPICHRYTLILLVQLWATATNLGGILMSVWWESALTNGRPQHPCGSPSDPVNYWTSSVRGWLDLLPNTKPSWAGGLSSLIKARIMGCYWKAELDDADVSPHRFVILQEIKVFPL